MAVSQRGIPTQGQLDWVALSTSSMKCTLEIAARIMHGGVDACTLLVGRGVCTSFCFPAAGQKVLHESMSQLRGFSSFRKVVWFGFGLKSIVHLLGETEHGALCVALSAALSIPYVDSYDAAEVWHHYCLLRGAPKDLRPAIHQWKSLVDACAGALHRSSFTYHYDHFARILAPEQNERLPTAPQDVAQGLATLADLSLQKVKSAVFVGRAECAWLAAVARCLLCLSIEIQDENGQRIYIGVDSPEDPIQVVFRAKTILTSKTSLVQHVCFIASGRELLHERIDFTSAALRTRSDWKRILSDSFPGWDYFSQRLVSRHFEVLLRTVALWSEEYYTAPSSGQRPKEELPWWLTWGSEAAPLFHPRRTGIDLLQFAYQTFPELHDVLTYPSTSFTAQAKDIDAQAEAEQALERLSACCKCVRCCKLGSEYPVSTDCYCYRRLAQTLVRLILMLAPVTLQDTIAPSKSAFRQVYNCTVETVTSARGHSLPESDIELVLYLFTGQYRMKIADVHTKNTICASGGGICVFYSLLKDPKQPASDFMSIEMIPGQVKHQERIYRMITDTKVSEEEKEGNRKALIERLSVTELDEDELVVDLVAEETKDRDVLSVSYRVVFDCHCTIDIGIGDVQKRLRYSMLYHRCPTTGCANSLFNKQRQLFKWSPTARPTSACQTVAEFEKFLATGAPSWVLLDWSYWKFKWLKSTSETPPRHIDIDIYRANNEATFLFLALIAKCDSHSYRTEKVGGSALLLVPAGVDCVVQTVLSKLLMSLPASGEEQIQLDLRNRLLDPQSQGRGLVLDVSVEAVQQRSRSQQGLLSLFGRRLQHVSHS